MALIRPTQPLAHYLHASVDRFSPTAIREVTRRFHEAAAAIGFSSASLSPTYDTQDHVFELNCVNNEGQALDALLSRTLKAYIANEEVEVTRFTECLSGDPFDEYDPEVERNAEPPPASESFTAHVVNFDGINTYGKAKAFRLRELPPELSLRAKSRQKIAKIENMITLRRIRWDEANQQHVSDGHVGQKLPKLTEGDDDDLSELFALLAFRPFTRADAAPKRIAEEAGPRQWEFVGPPPDTVEGWLEGQGQTKQLHPDVRPEMSKDAIRFTGDPATHQPIVGRIRMPKDAEPAGAEVYEHEEEPVKSEEQQNRDFMDLMKRGGGNNDDSEDSDTSESSSSRAAQGFAALLPQKSDEKSKIATQKVIRSIQATEEPPVADPTSAVITRPEARLTLAENKFPTISTVTTQANPDHESGFPSYNRRYAKVDNWGLTGDAANQAQWDHENASSLSSRRRRKPRTYESMAMERADSASSSAVNSSPYRQIQSQTPMRYRDTVLGGDEPWANNVVKPEIVVPEGELINTSGSVAGSLQYHAPRNPPGLASRPGDYPPQDFLSTSDHFPPLGHPIRDQRQQRALMPSGRSGSISSETMSMPHTHYSTPTTSMSMLTQGSAPQHMQQDDQPLIQFDCDDGLIIERLEPQSTEVRKVFRTMGQQATKGKKQKNKPRAKRTTTVKQPVLDRPSPPPSPKERKDNSPAKTDAGSPAKTVSDGTATTESEKKRQVQEAIIEHLSALVPVNETPELTVQFGLALLADGKILADSKASRLPALQGLLDDHAANHPNAAFIAALGRERVDGVYLLRLPDIVAEHDTHESLESSLKMKYFDCSEHGLSARLTYEIDIGVPGIGEWTLKFDQDQPENAIVLPVAANQPSLYVHYPQRVWDVRIQPSDMANSDAGSVEPSDHLKISMMRFLETFDTPASLASSDLPAFEADVVDTSFNVSKVLAKREFSQAMGSGIWLVTQVWDLHLQVDGSILAFAEDERIMREQGRLWWEAALKVTGMDGLEELMNNVVERLDPVGLAGLQTSKWAAKRSKPVVREEEYNPYW